MAKKADCGFPVEKVAEDVAIAKINELVPGKAKTEVEKYITIKVVAPAEPVDGTAYNLVYDTETSTYTLTVVS